ncbi:MAG: tRNA (adenosine(37)-N6)-threonylcarbamoyltransferase complex ATPase subunit type 1 TsaE [Nitrospira sp. BO4]|nr:tRNA (adenosine(37)-N6)-threonylcarbamoyltransferase complex ATPase subunit type 1 TsaE [Nitrospira sp. BO4]
MTRSVGSLDLILSSAGEMERLGYTIGQLLRGGETFALIGELGAGKTALVRGIVAGLGVPSASVTSPTFVLVHQYQGRLPLIHIDLYRLRTPEETESMGLSDYFTEEAVTAIEWADRFPGLLPEDRLEVRLTHRTPTSRKAQLEARGSRSRSLLARIKKAIPRVRRSARSIQTSLAVSRKASQR